MTLRDFLRERAALPFIWGQDDCSLVLADWWHANHGTDPAGWLRGTYSNRAECVLVILANRGLQRLVTRVADAAGAERTSAPDTGDFGLIAVDGRPYGAICTGLGFWAARSEAGVTFLTNPRILRAWSIHVGHDLAPKAA